MTILSQNYFSRFARHPHRFRPQIAAAMENNLQRSSEIPRLFSVMLGLNTNLTVDEFVTVSNRVHASFPGLSSVGVNQQLAYVLASLV